MQVNEFEDSNDKIGFLSSDADKFSYLSLESALNLARFSNANITYANWIIELG